MVLRVLGGIIATAAGALIAYQRAHDRSPDTAADSVVGIKRTTSVLLEIGMAVMSVIEALQAVSGSHRKHWGNNRIVPIGSLGRDLNSY